MVEKLNAQLDAARAAAATITTHYQGKPGAGGDALKPLRIAILLNSYRSRFIEAIRDSYVRTIGAVSPDSQLAFFYPVERDDFPDPERFDLVVIGGSNVDARKTSLSWVLRMHAFIARLARDHPAKKVCGICWGHQTISLAFGGEVVDSEPPQLGVAEIELTHHGRRFFGVAAQPANRGVGSLRLQQHHRREVARMPKGFVPLASHNQCFVNEANTILTFQGHPEKDAETAKLRIHDAERWFGTDLYDAEAVEKLRSCMELEHDGELVWRRVLAWAAEAPSTSPVSSLSRTHGLPGASVL